MPSFPNTLIRCIAEGRTPDECDIDEIALHIWKDMSSKANEDRRSDGFQALRDAAHAALCGSYVPHLDKAGTQQQPDGYRDERPSPAVRARHLTLARILLAHPRVRETA